MIELRSTWALRRKKPTDKFVREIPDTKAISTSIHTGSEDRWGSTWHTFEDARRWSWIQEAEKTIE